MTAIYRIPLETELAYLTNRLGVDDGEMLPGLVRVCYGLAFGSDTSTEDAGAFLPSLTHPDPAVWGPAFVYVQQLLPQFPWLRAAVHGLLDHPDPAVRLRLLHWQECPAVGANGLDTDEKIGANLWPLLRDPVDEVRFDAVLLTHQQTPKVLEILWRKGPLSKLLLWENSPEVRALITAVLAFWQGAPPAAAGSPRVFRLPLDRLSYGEMPGAWLSLDFKPEAMLHDQLGCPPDQKYSYDRRPGQACHAKWCAWRDQIRWIIQTALMKAPEHEPALDDWTGIDTLTAGMRRIEQRDYRQAYCPACGAAYEAAQMHHRDWSDGSERLAMMGGFEILCPEKHLLFTQMTRMS